MSDTFTRPMAEWEAQWFAEWVDIASEPKPDDQRRSWWGSYGYRARHAESD